VDALTLIHPTHFKRGFAMPLTRRRFLSFSALGLMAGLWAMPSRAAWPKALFEAKSLSDLYNAGENKTIATASELIEIKIADISDTPNNIPLYIKSHIPNTDKIWLIIERNVPPLAAEFNFGPDTQPAVHTRIQVAGDSRIQVIVEAQGKRYIVGKKVRIAS
jgi:predicted secreted protein